MAVEIHVLSGSQQGRRFRFDGDQILVGDAAVADVRFDPNRESWVRGKNAILTLDDEVGWQFSNMGAGVWLVNQTPVAPSQSHRLRSEDMVRASEAGPDFCFRLVAGPHGFAIPATVEPVSVASKPVSKQAEIATPAIIGPVEPTTGAEPAKMMPADEESVKCPGLAQRLVEFARMFRPSSTVPDAERESPQTFLSAPSRLDPHLASGQGKEDALTPGPSPASGRGEKEVAVATAPAPPIKRRRSMREGGLLGRLFGGLVSGLLGLGCAYGIACWIGGEKNDVLHIFYKKPPAAPAHLPKGEVRNSVLPS